MYKCLVVYDWLFIKIIILYTIHVFPCMSWNVPTSHYYYHHYHYCSFLLLHNANNRTTLRILLTTTTLNNFCKVWQEEDGAEKKKRQKKWDELKIFLLRSIESQSTDNLFVSWNGTLKKLEEDLLVSTLDLSKVEKCAFFSYLSFWLMSSWSS